ncbi:MAG TPA: 2OG-Fe(II) oxygenase [Albitalea sp.]|uniref:2OG-Fe(II) oxygenase n=1 Tax=Piscinibacter sp. TaxID=1903157 RepID=UPI002ED67AD2
MGPVIEATLPQADAAVSDHVCIRGVSLPLDRLVDPRRLAPESVATLHRDFTGAAPFPHLVLDGLFDPTLLDLVAQEFDLLDPVHWRRSLDGHHEQTLRSQPAAPLGHAAELYFGVLNSGWFVRFLQSATGVDNLIPDAQLDNGGFHEAQRGGRFRIHTDFNKHARTGLANEMVLITYLNRDWDPAWGGALELWSAKPRECVRRIEPVFGRTVLMQHGAQSFHGHPTPLELPPGRTRRSVAAYFYSHRPEQAGVRPHSTQFMDTSVLRWLRIGARELTPPLVWKAVKRLAGR